MDRRHPSEGRARGRGKPLDPTQQARTPGERPMGQIRPDMQHPERPQGWGQPQPPRPQTWGQPQAQAGGDAPSRQPPAVVLRPSGPLPEFEKGRGRATMPTIVAPAVAASSHPQAGAGDIGPVSASGDANRGAMRGRRFVHDIIRTRSDTRNTKCGTMGQVVMLKANYFRLNKSPQWHIYQYRVDFAPEVEHMMVRKGLIGTHKPQLGGYLFDGTMLFLTKRLPKEITEVYSTRRDGEQIRITIKFVGEISMMDGTALQILNLILRRAMEGLKLQLVGRNFFDAVAKTDLRECRLQLWPGYQTSIRQHEEHILVCCEIAHKVMRCSTVLDILRECSSNSRDFRTAFMQQMVGQVVLTDYNNKTYKIDDVDFDSSPKSTFSTKDGDISYIEYYKKRYNITIRDMNQPMLISRAKARDLRGGQNEMMALVPELCRSTGLTDAMRNDFRLMRSLADYTRLPPAPRMEELMKFNRRLRSTPESSQVFSEWDMDLDANLVEFNGRIIAKQKLKFGNNHDHMPDDNADWSSAFRNTAMFSCAGLNNWVVITCTKAVREAEQFVQQLIQVGRGMQFQIRPPRSVVIDDDRAGGYIKAIESISIQDPEMIMCVLATNNADRYSAIKKKCCVDRGIPSQVMVHKTITPKGGNPNSLKSVATKVAIQMNCKLGCAPWSIEMPLSDLMTIGFDVSHDTRDKSLSYGAMVATMDMKKGPKFFSAVSSHRNGEELSNELSLNVTKALREYRNLHGTLPAKLLIYRDGVGDGQIHYVHEHEIKHMKEALTKIYSDAGKPMCQITYIIVCKRINTRIFADKKNPLPGTVADSEITLPERYDFYLVSQCVRQGTVSPTSYNIILDEFGLKPDQIQILTYRMCHLYYNWSGTVRVPAMCQYAHKLSFLVGQFIHQSPSANLEKRLYFL